MVMKSIAIAKNCQSVLEKYLSNFSSLKGSSLQIASRIVAQSLKNKLSKINLISEISKATHDVLKLREIYTSGDNDIEDKLKIELLTLPELLEDAGFCSVTISGILNADLMQKDLEEMIIFIRKSRLSQREKKRKISAIKIVLRLLNNIKLATKEAMQTKAELDFKGELAETIKLVFNTELTVEKLFQIPLEMKKSYSKRLSFSRILKGIVGKLKISGKRVEELNTVLIDQEEQGVLLENSVEGVVNQFGKMYGLSKVARKSILRYVEEKISKGKINSRFVPRLFKIRIPEILKSGKMEEAFGPDISGLLKFIKLRMEEDRVLARV